MPGNRSARVALACGVMGLATPLVGAIPLVVLAQRNGDLLPGFVVLMVGIVLGTIGVVAGVLGRGSAGPEAPDRRRATLGIWLGGSAILASVLLSILLVGAAVPTFEF
jgi:hypothetical protein